MRLGKCAVAAASLSWPGNISGENYIVNSKEKPTKTSFTLTGTARDILAKRAKELGLSQTAVLELLIRMLEHPRLTVGFMRIDSDQAADHPTEN